MGYLSDDSRRESFASHRLAMAAAAAELQQAQALASAQAKAEAESVLVQRERSANEAKSEFISMLCHEIRTPLNGCLASAEMLLQTDLDDDQKDLAHTVRVSGSILLSTVSNFLDYFKIEAGKSLDVVRTPFELESLVADIHRIIEAMVGTGGDVALESPDLEGCPRTALGDPGRLCGVLLNLYMNAAKFTKKGSIGLRVRVVSREYRPAPPPHRVRTLTSATSTASASSSTSSEYNTLRNNTMPWPSQSSMDDSAADFGSGGGSSSNSNNGSNSDGNSNSSSSSSGEEESCIPTGIGSSIRMRIQDEGEGWLSTASAPQLGTAARKKERTPRHADAVNNGGNERAEWISFEVTDTGVGIPPRSLAALFHDYVQGDASEMDKPRTRSGTGLGLAICGKQVAVLGGVIGAVSKPGAGSVFWFKVPMVVVDSESISGAGDAIGTTATGVACSTRAGGKKGYGRSEERNNDVAYDTTTATTTTNKSDDVGGSADKDGQNLRGGLEHSWRPSFDASQHPSSSVPTSTPASKDVDVGVQKQEQQQQSKTGVDTNKPITSLQGLSVLVVEDNMINRKVACRVLQSLGADCEIASNGQEAIDVVAGAATAARRLDVVLMDMCMPVMGGVEATKGIRALGSTVPIVAMTANALERDREECLAAGMNGFLSKPVLQDQLRTCLMEVYNASRVGSSDSNEL